MADNDSAELGLSSSENKRSEQDTGHEVKTYGATASENQNPTISSESKGTIDKPCKAENSQSFVNSESQNEIKETSMYGQSSNSFGNRKAKGGNYKSGYRNYDKPSYDSSSKRYYNNNPRNYDENGHHRTSGRYQGHNKGQKWIAENRVTERAPINNDSPVGIANNGTNEAVMGSVVNGRYVRKGSSQQTSLPKTAPTSTNSDFRQNNYKSRPHNQNAKHRYGEKAYTTSNNVYNPEVANQSTIHKQPRRNEFDTHSFSSPRHITHKYFKRKEKSSGNYKISNDDLNNSDDSYLQDNFIPEEAVSQKLNLALVKGNSLTKATKAFSPNVKKVSTQRDLLIEQLEKGECECMVCCELIRHRDQVWSCGSCYHVFHLRCIKKWARSPAAIVPDCGWRCPGCQNISEKVPYNYYCFCGKSKEPEIDFHYTPHTCGEICGKQRGDKACTHRCNLLCHPGPCPSCSATVHRPCSCGKTRKVVPCNQSNAVVCDLLCEKLLNCGVHNCSEQCHIEKCKPCSMKIKQNCFCGRNEREVLCDSSILEITGYCCNMVCNKQLTCGHHKCASTCHTGFCPPCVLLPNAILSCPCGKYLLQELCTTGKAVKRTSCIDPVPVCGEKCQRTLSCGPKGNPHKCSADCHIGECPPCPLSTNIKCLCGSTSKEMPCVEASMCIFTCEKRCNRRKDCGRHKCLNTCCVNSEHKCELICNKKLSCGLHQCQENCHGGKCPTCWNVSFDELRCYCGESVLFPPIHCGTKPPDCTRQCTREHPCGHNFRHECHSEDKCPPCTVFTTKWCFGHHEKHSHVPCFLDGISCGKRCDKPLLCGRHTCKEVCHQGSCLKNTTQCVQSCEKLRSCGHPCAAPCHDGDCPDTSCKAKIDVSCPCGNRTEVATCSDDSSSYRLMSVSLLASKMHDIRAGESVNFNDLFSKKNKGNRLQCNEECAILERNKRLAVALQIQNPELSCKPGPPCYSEFVKEEARKSPKFVSNIFDKFTELVQLAKQSKQKSRSHAFPPMNRDQRRVIHEMAEFFGCETQSYDEEPVKNVVITAFRDKSWLPFVSIMAVIQREMGVRKGPVPLISPSTVKAPPTVPEKKEKAIDYFDFSG